jgi:nucleoside-diphosphate-sugar epimerase
MSLEKREIVMRLSVGEVEDRRRDRKKKILVTGATGLVGSHLALELIRRGYPVLLFCRRNRIDDARERVERLWKWFGVEFNGGPRPEVIDGLLDQPDLGLDSALYDRLKDEVGEIVHCAALTSFSERKRAQVEEANVDCLKNVLDLAAAGGCYFFHLVSTAYAAGLREGVCGESFEETGRFNNVYEETKHRAERLALEACREAGIRLGIYRPSIIFGDSQTGRTFRFNALYYPVRTILFFRDIFERDLRDNGGRRAAAMGVRADSGGVLHLPLRFEKREEGGINLIPVDYFVSAFMALMEESREGGIFQIVNRRQARLDDLVGYVNRYFGLSGIRAACSESFEETPRNALEILFDTYLEAYQPYIRDLRSFSGERTEGVLARRGISCPEFDFEMFRRCMAYAVETGWGKKNIYP